MRRCTQLSFFMSNIPFFLQQYLDVSAPFSKAGLKILQICYFDNLDV